MSGCNKSDDAQPESWVVSHDYEGPNRRHRAAWFKPKARLDDAHADSGAEEDSIDTLMRRVSVWSGLAAAARDKRAEFLDTLEVLAQKGCDAGHPVWPDIIAACASYVRAVGADGTLDEILLSDALLAAVRARVANGQDESAHRMVMRLDEAARRG